MKITGKFGAAALALLVLAGGVYYFVRSEPPESPAAPPQRDDIPAALLEGNKLVEKKNGKVTWELSANTIALDKATGKITLVDVKAVFYREDGNQLNVTSKTGSFDNKTRDITLAGDVNAVSTDGATLVADTVDWRQKEELITAKGNVRLTRPDVTATAEEAQTDKALEQIRLSGNAVIIKGGGQS